MLPGDNNANTNTKTLQTLKSTINNDLNLDNTNLTPESENISLFSYIMKIIRYILVIYLVAYIILTILNQLDLLPLWLKDLFSPFDLVERIYYNKDNNNTKKSKNNTQEPELATSIEKEKPRPESIPPTPLPQEGNPLPKPDLSTSTTQSSKIANKSGYCYIGEDRGFRSCIKIKQGDKCMSGNIFPTEAICINPNLRP
jgi:cytoskeletal protein RodZ